MCIRMKGLGQSQPHGTLPLKFLSVDPLKPWVRRIEHPIDQLVGPPMQFGNIDAKPSRKLLENPPIGLGLPPGADHRIGVLKIVVAVRGVDIRMFQKRRSREQVVCIVGRIGLEMLQHHRQERVPG